jgi:hypothetical protein
MLLTALFTLATAAARVTHHRDGVRFAKPAVK